MHALFSLFFNRFPRFCGALVFVFLGALPALAQTSSVVTTPQVRAELVAYAPQGVEVGQTFWLGLVLSHEPDWHTYWVNPGDSGLATEMSWNLPAGLDVGDVLWPLPQQLKASTLTNYGFEGRVLLAVPVHVSSQFKPGFQRQVTVQMHANWLICRRECIPQEGDFSLNLPITSSTAMMADEFDRLLSNQPQPITSAQVQARATDMDGHQVLTVNVSGLPKSLRGQSLEVFAKEPEILASASHRDPVSKQHWQADHWQVQLPLHKLRTATPEKLSLLLISSQGTRQGWWLDVPVSGSWPAPRAGEAADLVELPEPAPISDLNVTVSTVLGAMIGALLGGLILNLMPCVLPVLAIKLLHFAQHHESARQRHLQGAAYTVGVVLSFVVLGGFLVVLRASGQELGWGFQLQSPWFVLGLSVLFTLIALSLFGLFEVGQLLPASWLSYQSHHPVINAGLSGVLAVVVASPCTAPFMGASLGLAMTLPTGVALLVFACMGLGLALPYALASAWPHLTRYLPRPGHWMVWLRQFFGFPMLATVIWLLWVFALQTSLNVSLTAWMGLLCLSAAVWAARLRSPVGYGLRVLLWAGTVGLFVVTSEGVSADADLESAISSSSVSSPNAPSLSNDAASPIWNVWSAKAVDEAQNQGHPVFVDFTAAWCVTCQINKRTVLSHPQVLQAFAKNQVVLLRADWTRRDPAITRALNALGRSGVPVYVLYRPSQPPVVLSELLSQSELLGYLGSQP